MEVRWVRGGEKVTFSRPSTWFCLGVRGSGKSSFLETLACHYLAEGSAILDLFASRDAENLAWLRSPFVQGKRVLLIHGENVDIESSYDAKPASNLSLSDFETYDFLISSPPFYHNFDSELSQVALLTDKIYRRLHWKKLIFCIMREASNFFYSRQKLTENQNYAKTQATYMLREARHCGLGLGLDSIRYLAIDINVRAISDYLILKSQGLDGLSSDLSWLYSYFEPSSVRLMPPQFFFIVSRWGSVGVGEFKEVPWHKREKEDILRAVGVKVEYGESIEDGQYRGVFKTVGDKEHSEIIRLYVDEGLGMKEMATRVGRSSGTIHSQIHKHNNAIEQTGRCPLCKRAGASHQNVLAIRETV